MFAFAVIANFMKIFLNSDVAKSNILRTRRTDTVNSILVNHLSHLFFLLLLLFLFFFVFFYSIQSSYINLYSILLRPWSFLSVRCSWGYPHLLRFKFILYPYCLQAHFPSPSPILFPFLFSTFSFTSTIHCAPSFLWLTCMSRAIS